MNERAKRLSEAIEKSGYSYPELEKITGIPKSSIQRYATGGTKKIPIDCIEKIALATNADSRYLMCWEDKPTKQEGENEKIMTVLEKRGDMLAFVNLLVDNEEEIDRDAIEKTMTMVETFFLDKKNKE